MIHSIKKKILDKLNKLIDKRFSYNVFEKRTEIARILIEQMPAIKNLDYKLNRVNKMLLDIYPEVLIFDEETIENAKKFLRSKGFDSNINFSVSKNDLMFQYNLLQEMGDFRKALVEYLQDAYESYLMILRVFHDYNRDISKEKAFLDFACGYGKLDRLLVKDIEPKYIWASDIKDKANKFVTEQFKVNSISSSFNPEEFSPEKKFTTIFVGSLFSHLNEALFKKWLAKLYSCLDQDGILILSLHDISLIPEGVDTSSGKVFYPTNEDMLLEQVEDSIEEGEKYGTSYYSEKVVKKIIMENLNKAEYKRYKNALWGTQDVYVIER